MQTILFHEPFYMLPKSLLLLNFVTTCNSVQNNTPKYFLKQFYLHLSGYITIV